MSSQFRAEVYRNVARCIRGQAADAGSLKIQTDMQSIAHGYDLMAESIERHSRLPANFGNANDKGA